MKLRILSVIVASSFLLPAAGFSQNNSSVDAQDPQQSVEPTPAREQPYEIVVNPTMTRMNLRSLIDTVEDDFFERFNELNIDENYDIVCYKHTPIMSHISERVCEPLFLWRARGANSSEVTFLLGSTSKDAVNQATGSANLVTPNAMRKDKQKDFDILQQKMEELNASDEKLRSIGSVLAQLRARLASFGKDQ